MIYNPKPPIFDYYRVKIVTVEDVSEFRHIERLISEDDEVAELELTEELLNNLALHRTHMLNQIDEAVMNY